MHHFKTDASHEHVAFLDGEKPPSRIDPILLANGPDLFWSRMPDREGEKITDIFSVQEWS
jgi:hypothetical protein